MGEDADCTAAMAASSRLRRCSTSGRARRSKPALTAISAPPRAQAAMSGAGPVVPAVHFQVQRPDTYRPAGVLGQAEGQPASPAAAVGFLDIQLVHEGVPPVELEAAAERQDEVPGRRAARPDEPHPAE